MEPDAILPEQKNDQVPVGDVKPDADGLHAEGVDLEGSSVAIDNEFSKPEEVYDQTVAAPYSEPTTPSAPTTPVSATPPVSAPVPQTFNDPSIKQLRTFKSDAEEAVKYGNVSKASIAVAEQKKREESGEIKYMEAKHSSPGVYIGIVAVIVIALAGGWYYWFNSSKTSQEKIVVPTVSIVAFVPYSKTAIFQINQSSDPIVLIAEKAATVGPVLGTVAALAPISNASATVMSPITDVFAQTHISSRLLRSLSNNYMLGVYAYDVQSPFFILKNTFFQNAYAGMLDWEKDLGSDLTALIQVSDPTITSANANTGTFEDAVISNVNVRILKDSSGKILLAYAFADKDTIILTTNTTALKFLLDRILQVRTIQ